MERPSTKSGKGGKVIHQGKRRKTELLRREATPAASRRTPALAPHRISFRLQVDHSPLVGESSAEPDSWAGCHSGFRFVVGRMPPRERGRPARTIARYGLRHLCPLVPPVSAPSVSSGLAIAVHADRLVTACNVGLTLRHLQPGIRLRAGRPRSRGASLPRRRVGPPPDRLRASPLSLRLPLKGGVRLEFLERRLAESAFTWRSGPVVLDL